MHPGHEKVHLGLELKLFPEVKTGLFIRRRNRFVVECVVDNKVIQAYLPNSGRLWELLLPGRTMYLAKNASSERKHQYTAVGVEREDTLILLHTRLANTVVQWLIERGKIPSLAGFGIVKREVTFGSSRFDFLLQKGDQQFLLEVKSCTLFGKHIAMFPDAVTLLGRRHLIELAGLSKKGMHCGVIFLVSWPNARFFLPDYHTDIDFGRTCYDLRNDLIFLPVAIGWKSDITLGSDIRMLEIPWDLIGREAKDSGSYILILHSADDLLLPVGSLGEVPFRQGYYIYAGSAKKNLMKRIQRHLKKRKKFFWHIDYLRDHADRCLALPVRSSTPLEHNLAGALGKISDWSVPGFGSSDCSCKTHLFGMHTDPLESSQFMEVLQYFRIDRLEEELFQIGENICQKFQSHENLLL